MPFTAKLSKRFYDQLGDETVNELVELLNQVDAAYRLELREANELNFTRFDARMEQRLTLLDAKLGQRISDLDLKLEREIGAVRTELRAEIGELKVAFHREQREQTRWIVGVIVALWATLLIPILGLYAR